MKKLIIILLIFISFFTIGCDPVGFDPSFHDMLDQTKKIELRYVINKNLEKIELSDDSHPTFDYESSMIIDELDNALIPHFIYDFVEKMSFIEYDNNYHEYKYKFFSPNSPNGFILILYQNNNDMLVLNCIEDLGSMYARFDKESNYIKIEGIIAHYASYYSLLEKYFGSSMNNYSKESIMK